MRSTVEAGGADLDNARRSGPGACDLRRATGTRGASMAVWVLLVGAAPKTVAAGTAEDRWRGSPCAAVAAPVGLPPGRARRSCRPATVRPPATPGRLDLSSRPFYFASVVRACWRNQVLAVRPRRAEGAPLMIVKKIFTASVWRPSDRPGAGLAMATRGSRIEPRWFGWSGRRRCPIRRRRHERCPGRGAGSGRSFPGSRGRHCLGLRSGRSGLG